nr:MAG TPA: hypothetical protein [Caudoviricetes sp.]
MEHISSNIPYIYYLFNFCCKDTKINRKKYR